ncbi:hypothetical protein LTR50_004610 [Elasticomyces elasticus]|nr:hypothetical protein LTR50_004610 [Elasticomyces elasticus]
MAPPLSADDHTKFLISCIRNTENGKPKFAEVAKECDIVSAGAAAKRYERLLKANGISTKGAAAAKRTVTTPTKVTKSTKKGTPKSTRKLKAKPAAIHDDDDDDDDKESVVKGEDENKGD